MSTSSWIRRLPVSCGVIVAGLVLGGGAFAQGIVVGPAVTLPRGMLTPLKFRALRVCH